MVEIFLKWNSLVERCSIADEYGIGHSVDHYQTAVYFDICLHCLLNLPVPILRIFSCHSYQWDKNISLYGCSRFFFLMPNLMMLWFAKKLACLIEACFVLCINLSVILEYSLVMLISDQLLLFM